MMRESMQDELVALREAIEQFPIAPAPTPQAMPDGQALPATATTRGDLRWAEIDRQLEGQIAGRRVLVVGSGVAYDASAFAARDAEHVLACEPPEAAAPMQRRESGDRPSVDFQRIPWGSLDPVRNGTFDVIHCSGLLHRVLEPVELLRTLRRMMTPGGTMLIASMMLADPDRSEFLRFIPDRFAGDPTWWFLPGRLAFRWMVQMAGFEIEDSFGEQEGPRDEFPVITGYLRAAARE